MFVVVVQSIYGTGVAFAELLYPAKYHVVDAVSDHAVIFCGGKSVSSLEYELEVVAPTDAPYGIYVVPSFATPARFVSFQLFERAVACANPSEGVI
jgi:hypothetical protein